MTKYAAIGFRSLNVIAMQSIPKPHQRGSPKMIVSDNGTEFTSNAILNWADEAKVDWHYIAPAARQRFAFKPREGVNPNRTASSKALMENCVTKNLMTVCSAHCTKRVSNWQPGETITTITAPTQGSAGSRHPSSPNPQRPRKQWPWTLRYLMSTCPWPLHHKPNRA